jgi:hypothetical protein
LNPHPRIAQNKSGLDVAESFFTLPSAKTIVAATTLSIDNPYFPITNKIP